MRRSRNEMGRLPGYRQVTLYVDPLIYERVRCAAYTLGEDIYEFVGEALDTAVNHRLTTKQRAAVDSMARQNIKNINGSKTEATNGRHDKRR